MQNECTSDCGSQSAAQSSSSAAATNAGRLIEYVSLGWTSVEVLNEDFDDYGRLIQRLGTRVSLGNNNQGLPTWGRAYMDAATETPKSGEF